MIVLDANAAYAIASGGESGELLEKMRDPGEAMIAPRAFCAELAHAVRKYYRGGYITADQGNIILRNGIESIDEFSEDEELIAEAFTESLRLNHSVYDLLYFVLARRAGATLFTLDRKLQQICEENLVSCIWLEP